MRKYSPYIPPKGNSVELRNLLIVVVILTLAPIVIGLRWPAYRSAIGIGFGIGSGLSVIVWLLAIWPGWTP